MSPRKLTEDDKQEILKQYRNSEATTSTLAKSFEVSSSTISRFLKNKLTTVEYEDLIQQKRLARTPRGEKSVDKGATKAKTAKKTKKTKIKAETKEKEKPKAKAKAESKQAEVLPVANDDAMPEFAPAQNQLVSEPVAETEPVEEIKPATEPTRTRRRRRSVSNRKSPVETVETVSESSPDPDTQDSIAEEPVEADSISEAPPAKLVLDDVRSKSDRLILKSDLPEPEEEDEEDEMDMQALKEMLGEDLEDINDDEEDDDDWEESEENDYSNRAANLNDIEILPLSQASLPRICYLVIDRSAELIVKPLAEFADLGVIPEAEVRQRTLPVFDNHRIAKRFSHRRERVIKVPDGRMLQKTSHHLQDKGITRLLIDGQIYSLSH